jgi:hypothetical protein
VERYGENLQNGYYTHVIYENAFEMNAFQSQKGTWNPEYTFDEYISNIEKQDVKKLLRMNRTQLQCRDFMLYWLEKTKYIDESIVEHRLGDPKFAIEGPSMFHKELSTYMEGDDAPRTYDFWSLKHYLGKCARISKNLNFNTLLPNLQFDVDIIDKDLVKIEVKEAASTKISSNLGGQLIVPSIINTDTSMDFWQNKPRILYDNGVISMSTHKYHIGVLSWFNETDYLLFSPVDIYPITSNTKSLDFGIVDYGIGGTAVLKSLYNEYWAKYIDELYHKDTRIATVKAFLSAKDISDFRFNDVIMIKNKKYRVKKIDYNQNHLSKLELITIKDL